MKIVKNLLKLVIFLILLVVAALGILIGIAVVTDYKPADKETLEVTGIPTLLEDSLTLTLMTWNLGFGGLGKEMDFFYDGGKKVNTTEEICLQNIAGIRSFVEKNDSIDFLLFQEIDVNSRRSYHRNEVDTVREVLQDHIPLFAKNYDVFFVPRPFTEPIGKVESGIALFSRYIPTSSERIALPGKLGFPTWLFYLDRCFIVNSYPLSSGKELVLINTHNEAYDEGGVRLLQMDFMKEFMIKEYEKGNYVIAGGDWNQCPPGYQPAYTGNVVKTEQMQIETGFLPDDWHWIYDPGVPTNRSIDIPYDQAVTTTTVIDYFLSSPNVTPIEAKGIHLGFVHSDHNPMIIKVTLN